MHILHTDFYMPQFDRHRTIYLYLPPDYDNSNKRYPVIYAQDGQNLFNEATAFQREWKIDKTLNNLHKKKDYGAIVVGIANGGGHRIREYGHDAHKYVDFIADTLKPFIDTHFKTLPTPAHTALLGSSLGGLLALQGIVQRGDVFGKAGALSPSLWFNRGIYDFVQHHINPHHKVYVSGSKTENRYMGSSLQGMYWALHHAGMADTNMRVALRDKGRHNEVFWCTEFKKMYTWLFE